MWTGSHVRPHTKPARTALAILAAAASSHPILGVSLSPAFPISLPALPRHPRLIPPHTLNTLQRNPVAQEKTTRCFLALLLLPHAPPPHTYSHTQHPAEEPGCPGEDDTLLPRTAAAPSPPTPHTHTHTLQRNMVAQEKTTRGFLALASSVVTPDRMVLISLEVGACPLRVMLGGPAHLIIRPADCDL